MSYTIGYRTGGTDNFKWNRTLSYEHYQEALQAKQDIERCGRPAIIYRTRELDSIGLPETYCEHDPRLLTGLPIGMYHCPVCDEMVVATFPH